MHICITLQQRLHHTHETGIAHARAWQSTANAFWKVCEYISLYIYIYIEREISEYS